MGYSQATPVVKGLTSACIVCFAEQEKPITSRLSLLSPRHPRSVTSCDRS